MYSRRKEQDVWVQDQATPPFQYFLMQEVKSDITLTSDVTKGDTIINVSSGHGFLTAQTPPHYLVLQEGESFHQAKVTGVSTDAITVDEPVGVSFTTGGTTVIRGVIDMNVDGTTPKEYDFNMRSGIPIDIQYAVITIWNDAAAGDDSLFGDLTALSNGLRIVKENNINLGLGLYNTNGE